MTAARQPVVSVLTPVHNGEAYLAECIESVLDQTYPYWQHLILDNQSTDRTSEIAQAYAARDARIRVVTTERFVDVIENHNIACRSVPAEASYVKFVHADDWLFPRCLEEMVRVGEDHPGAGIVSAYRLEEKTVPRSGLPHNQELFSGRDVCRQRLLRGYPPFGSPSSHLIRSEVVRSRDPYFNGTRFSIHADTASCYDVLRSWDLGFVHQILTFTRRHDKSQAAGSRRLNTSIAASLLMLETYGPEFLTPDEYAAQLKYKIHRYHNYLARCTLHWKDSEFWRFHRESLHAAGHRLSYLGLAMAVIEAVLDTSPADLVRKAGRFANRTRRHLGSSNGEASAGRTPGRGKAPPVRDPIQMKGPVR
jgi:glycosyltransferase involved in cell wall biosynthesis